ncbi:MULTISPECIES: FGGY family carbohydrate kinase [unclassified Roseitalea]|uniref:xylulokinase n=1 Tax=unclassified Roseitalea TaxID=2639107 RepID=UPI00273E5EA2|nr:MULTISPECIES: FGGY family carbohydrate kinase [unclassified Roseitalea]
MRARGYLGIDLGTSAVKVLIHDDDGAVLAKTSRPYATKAPQPGWAEQDPDEWWGAVCAATREAIAEAGVEIASVGLSGQLNGFVLLDAAMRPLADAVIWLDIRAEAEAGILAETLDFPAVTGNALSAICVLPKLVWFRANRPELMERTRRIALAKDYILLRLTGELATDPCDAHSTAMTGRGGTQFAPDLCALAGVTPQTMPTIRPAAEIAGRVGAQGAKASGIAPGTPVATGAGDVAALAVGCGIVARGRTTITLGTAGHVVTEATAPEPRQRHGLWQIPHGIAGRDLWLGLIMTGGLSLSWFRAILAQGGAPPAFEALDRLAAHAPPGSEGAVFLPFLEGVATPYGRPDARGMFFGLSSAHGTGHMVRAVMEGVAFNARQCVRAHEAAGAATGEVRLAEGGAQSPLWCQIMADALRRPVHLIAERDTSAAGAAIVGRAALEGADVATIAERSVHIAQVFAPDAEASAALDDAFARYAHMCERLFGAD